MPSRGPIRGTLPYSASAIASSRLVLPAPVGPVMTNRSSSAKSIACGSRKAVKAATSSLRGRTGHLVEQLVEQLQHRVVRRSLVALEVVAREHLPGRQPPQLGGALAGVLPRVVEPHLQRVRQDL